MKKLNFDNKVSGDDDILISILKESIGQEPSEQFAENTLQRFWNLKTRQNHVHKPLKSPLYMMLFIGMLLLTPSIFSFGSQISVPNHGFEMENLFENMAFQLDSWYAITLTLLLLVLMSVVWIQAGAVKFRNPFIW